MAESREAQCPRRGPGLSHIQSMSQRPDGSCIYCSTPVVKGDEDRVPGFHPDDMDGSAGHPLDVEEADEGIRTGSIASRLLALGLIRPSGSPVDARLAPDCIVDHNSLRAWGPCSQCQVVHEPKLATGEASGVTWGPGRGGLTNRLKLRLGFIRWLAARQDP